jgi:hypothetical protein
VKNGTKSSKFLADFFLDLTNYKWRIMADFCITSSGFEKHHLATLIQNLAQPALLINVMEAAAAAEKELHFASSSFCHRFPPETHP